MKQSDKYLLEIRDSIFRHENPFTIIRYIIIYGNTRVKEANELKRGKNR